jgi:hypothetical protein
MDFSYPKEELKRLLLVAAVAIIAVASLSQWANKTNK